TQLLDQRLLVTKMVVDRRRRIFDPIRDCTHRDRVDPVLHEHVARSIQDLGLRIFARTNAPFLWTHRPALQTVYLTLLGIIGATFRGVKTRLGSESNGIL